MLPDEIPSRWIHLQSQSGGHGLPELNLIEVADAQLLAREVVPQFLCGQLAQQERETPQLLSLHRKRRNQIIRQIQAVLYQNARNQPHVIVTHRPWHHAHRHIMDLIRSHIRRMLSLKLLAAVQRYAFFAKPPHTSLARI